MTLIGSTISNNKSAGGDAGGIYNEGTMTLTNSTVSGNTGGYHGAIYNEGVLSLTGSAILSNTASNDGGGIFNKAGTLTVTSSVISGNSARRDGGLFNEGFPSNVNLINSTFSGNSASYDGGAIFNWDAITLTGCTLSRNTVGEFGGGAIENDSGSGNGAQGIARMILKDTTLSDNSVTFRPSTGTGSASQGGGAIRNLAGVMTLIDSTLSGNTAPGLNGGGIENYGAGDLTLIDSTLSGNSAAGTGGGINSQGFGFNYGPFAY
jgi:hypothetical protein